MDCGPAALKCVFEGFGVNVSYGRLREACQTSVDGTSIDTLEEVAALLGLEAAQLMLPVEHAVAARARTLPAIAVVRMPSGLTHFVVLWRRLGPYLQVMDPARGRRWVRAAAFLRDLYVHTQSIEVASFREFVADPMFAAILAARLAALGGSHGDHQALIAAAIADESWQAIARLDGATRATETLIAAGLLSRGDKAQRLWRALAATPNAIAEDHACVTRAGAGPGGEERVLLRGAVLIHLAGRAPPQPAGARPLLAAELAAAISEDENPFARARAAWDPKQTWPRALLLVPLLVLVAVGGLAEVVLSRPLLSAGAPSGAPRAFAALLALGATVLGAAALELPLVAGARALGRTLDVELRRAFFRKLPRLGDRYFASRPVSDMAERAHLIHRVRLFPGIAVQLGRVLLELGLALGAIAWLYPDGAALAAGLFVAACTIPFLAAPVAAERDLRLRTHAGALLRFYLDALLGLPAVRTHGAGPALVREHGDRLAEWRRAGRDLVRTSARIEALTVFVAVAGAAGLVNGYLRTHAATPAAAPGTAFLLLFLALRIPTQATTIVGLWRQFPEHRNVTLRLLEPLGAPEDETPDGEASRPEAAEDDDTTGPAAIAFRDVHVEVAGHLVLRELTLRVAPGEHVAVVGASGAGKSTLVGLALGFHRPARGEVLVDGYPLRGEVLARLRADTAWVEPAVQLWNRTLEENIAYGAPTSLDRLAPERLAAALADADLTELTGRIPAGTASLLGEGGGLVSGGEGQRIRFARALARRDRPRLVLLDEPFRGLDRDVRLRLLARARARWAGATLIFVTHDLAHTLEFPRVLVVDEGRVVEDGAPEELAGRPGSLYQRLSTAETRVRAERWSASFWRRVTVHDGHVEADDPDGHSRQVER